MQGPRHWFGQVGVVHPQKLVRRSRRVGERAQHVEQGPNPHLLTWACRVFHGPVENRSEEKTEAGCVNALPHRLRRLIQVRAQFPENIGAAQLETERLPCLATLSPAPARINAMVVDNVEASGPVSAGAACVNQWHAVSLPLERARPCVLMTVAAPVISATVSPFIFKAVSKHPDLSRRGCSRHNLIHGPFHFLTAQIFSVCRFSDGLFEHFVPSFGNRWKAVISSVRGHLSCREGHFRQLLITEFCLSCRLRVEFCRHIQEIPEHVLACRGENRFRVELDPFNGIVLVSDAHDLSFIGPSSYF